MLLATRVVPWDWQVTIKGHVADSVQGLDRPVTSDQSEQGLDTCVLLPEVGDVKAGFDAGADVVESGGLPLDDKEATRMWKVDRFWDRPCDLLVHPPRC